MRNFVMVGAGGTGSHLIHPLVTYANAIKDSLIHIWDADAVEEKNLDRQLFYAIELLRNKATALSERFPATCQPHEAFVSENNVAEVIQEGDTVLICADNMAVRRLINNHAKTLQDITVINGGNEKTTGSVQVFIRRKGKNITPSLDFWSPEFAADTKDDRSGLSCAEIALLPGGEQTMLANNGVAALMLQALWRVDNNVYKRNPQWTKITFDMPGGTVQTSDVRLIGGVD